MKNRRWCVQALITALRTANILPQSVPLHPCLGHLGLLKGHNAVCFPGYEKELGADKVLHDPVCVSGKIITARGAGVAVDFALKLVEVLYGKEKSQEIRKDIQCV